MHPNSLRLAAEARTRPPGGPRHPRTDPGATARVAFVSDEVATGGRGAVLSLVQLERVLGKPAARVWAILRTVRSPTGDTHLTRLSLAERAGLSEPAVKRALARLRLARLVVDVGWLHLSVRCTTCPADLGPVHDHEVFVRSVRGDVRTGAHGSAIARVPKATEAWSLSAPRRGGPRAGAGRPPGAKDVRPRPSRATVKVMAPTSPVIPGFTDDGILVGTAPPPAQHPVAALALLPRFPGTGVVAPAIVPEPPFLPDRASDEVLARACVLAYRVVHTAEVGVGWYRPANVIARASPKIAAAAHLLREHHLRPLRWVQWSFKVWRDLVKKPGPPPIAWVFNAERVAEHREWFRGEWGTYQSGRIVLGPVHRALLVRYAGMTAAVARGTPPVQAIRDAFPDGLYSRLVEAARKENQNLAADLASRAAAGELLD